MVEKKSPWWVTIQKMFRARGWLAVLMILLAGWSAVYSWKHPQVQIVPTPYYIPMPGKPGPVVEKIVYVDKIVVVEKSSGLPDSIATDTKQQVTAVGTVAPYEGNTSVAAIIKLPEGKTTLMMKREPLPFFSFENKAWLIGGIGLEETSAAFEWEYARIGKARVSIYAETNTRPEAMVQVRVKIPIW